VKLSHTASNTIFSSSPVSPQCGLSKPAEPSVKIPEEPVEAVDTVTPKGISRQWADDGRPDLLGYLRNDLLPGHHWLTYLCMSPYTSLIKVHVTEPLGARKNNVGKNELELRLITALQTLLKELYSFAQKNSIVMDLNFDFTPDIISKLYKAESGFDSVFIPFTSANCVSCFETPEIVEGLQWLLGEVYDRINLSDLAYRLNFSKPDGVNNDKQPATTFAVCANSLATMDFTDPVWSSELEEVDWEPANRTTFGTTVEKGGRLF
jgi:hypothetical protein